MWFFFALASACLYAFRGVFEKRALAKVNRYVLGLAIRLFALPFFVLPFLIKPDLWMPLPELPGEFWLAVIAVSVIGTPIETYFYYKALKQEELSLALPILSLAPVLTIVFAAIIFGEIPTLAGALGVVAILLGVYALKIGHARHGWLEPLYHLSRSQGVKWMAIVAIMLAIGSVMDKMGVTASNVFMYALVNYVMVSAAMFVFAWAKARSDLGQLATHFKTFALIGAVVAGYTLAYLVALRVANTAYVTAIRNASVLITILLGVFWLKERDRASKILAGCLIFAGLILIKVFG